MVSRLPSSGRKGSFSGSVNLRKRARGSPGQPWGSVKKSHRFGSNEVRLWLSVIAYNLGNLWRRLVLPKRIDHWSLTSLQQRLVKTGGRLVKHARYYWLLLAEGHLTRQRFGSMLRMIAALPLPDGWRTRRNSESTAQKSLSRESVSGKAGWKRETGQASQRNCQTSRACHATAATVVRA